MKPLSIVQIDNGTRTAQSNQIRGLLSEFGIIMPKGIASLERDMP